MQAIGTVRKGGGSFPILIGRIGAGLDLNVSDNSECF